MGSATDNDNEMRRSLEDLQEAHRSLRERFDAFEQAQLQAGPAFDARIKALEVSKPEQSWADSSSSAQVRELNSSLQVLTAEIAALQKQVAEDRKHLDALTVKSAESSYRRIGDPGSNLATSDVATMCQTLVHSIAVEKRSRHRDIAALQHDIAELRAMQTGPVHDAKAVKNGNYAVSSSKPYADRPVLEEEQVQRSIVQQVAQQMAETVNPLDRLASNSSDRYSAQLSGSSDSCLAGFSESPSSVVPVPVQSGSLRDVGRQTQPQTQLEDGRQTPRTANMRKLKDGMQQVGSHLTARMATKDNREKLAWKHDIQKSLEELTYLVHESLEHEAMALQSDLAFVQTNLLQTPASVPQGTSGTLPSPSSISTASASIGSQHLGTASPASASGRFALPSRSNLQGLLELPQEYEQSAAAKSPRRRSVSSNGSARKDVNTTSNLPMHRDRQTGREASPRNGRLGQPSRSPSVGLRTPPLVTGILAQRQSHAHSGSLHP
eukprot:CAMPEP_0178438354 /NCGR_PEP_ID=MMETSP0689_2-20121128/35548_1 /TAXON_ID=160604 /ORGANISM="Amphidinium massartii, Strain CS-259" /LENGTH=493 /DNA_ID=CAMNT_0020060751 /DNA_START=79 /DNA_END=1556 /DNA_ORIENTATION=+